MVRSASAPTLMRWHGRCFATARWRMRLRRGTGRRRPSMALNSRIGGALPTLPPPAREKQRPRSGFWQRRDSYGYGMVSAVYRVAVRHHQLVSRDRAAVGQDSHSLIRRSQAWRRLSWSARRCRLAFRHPAARGFEDRYGTGQKSGLFRCAAVA